MRSGGDAEAVLPDRLQDSFLLQGTDQALAQAAPSSICTRTERGSHCTALLTGSFCCFSFCEP